MRDWNVVVTLRHGPRKPARRALERLGWVDRTHYHDVWVMAVDDVSGFPARLQACLATQPEVAAALAHAVPLADAFDFKSAEEFHDCVRDAALLLAPQLAGKSFHVRMHRRGFKGRLTSVVEEQALDTAIVDRLRQLDGGSRIGSQTANSTARPVPGSP